MYKNVLTVCTGSEESYDEDPDHDGSGEPQQQQEQQTDQHGDQETTETRGQEQDGTITNTITGHELTEEVEEAKSHVKWLIT